MKIRKLFPYACLPLSFFPLGLVISCSSKETPPEEPTKPNYKITFNNVQTSYEINTNYNITANVEPNGNDYVYQWSTTSSSLQLSNSNTQTVSFQSTQVGDFVLEVKVLNKDNELLATQTINLVFVNTNVETNYSVSIISDVNFVFEEQNTYYLSAKLDKELSGAKYKWILPDFYVSPTTSLDEQQVGFIINNSGEFDITVEVYDVSQKLVAQQTKRVNVSPSQPSTPIYSVKISGTSSKYYVNNQYQLTAILEPSLPNAYYDWTSSDSNNLNLIPNENSITIQPKTLGDFTINLDVWNNAQKQSKLASTSISISVDDYDLVVVPDATYDINKTYWLRVDVEPASSQCKYQWSAESSSNIHLTNANSQTVSFVANKEGKYELSVAIFDQNDHLLATRDQIFINVVNTPSYSVSFKQTTSFNYGDNSKLVNDSSINEDWIKNKIIDNKYYIFEIPSTLPLNFDWTTNIIISNIQRDDNNHSITFTLTLNNANEQGSSINQDITFTGFKDPNSNLPSSDYEIQFKNNSSFPTIFHYGDPNVLPSKANYNNIKTKIIANKEQIFDIPSNVPSDFNWDQNLSITDSQEDDATGMAGFRVVLWHNTSVSTADWPLTIENWIVFDGFKQGFAYKINFDTTTNSYVMGDPNTLASNISDEWIKQTVITNKTKIFTYGKIPDNFDWNKNIEISNINRNNEARSISFELSLNNANDSSGKITKNIIFNDFKQIPWQTNSMPSDTELMLNDLKKPNGIVGTINKSQAPSKLNEYGVIRSFALVQKILLDSLFNDLGFINTSINMINDHFNNITFNISGTSSKSISNWGKKKIPLSSFVENWEGLNINPNDKVELTIKYIRNTNSSHSNVDTFDTSLVQWTPNITGLDSLIWNGFNISFGTYTTEFSSWASIKVNSHVVKQSSTNDNRVFVLFINHNNGDNYLIQSNNIISTYRQRYIK